MKVSVRNMTDFDVDGTLVEALVKELEEWESADSSKLSLAFVDDESMKKLHESYYGEPGTTDVLTFNYDNGTLEIVLNPYQHRRQAENAGNSFAEETVENLVHGYLHGQGYDHTRDDGEHLTEQRRLMRKLDTSLLDIIEDGVTQ